MGSIPVGGAKQAAYSGFFAWCPRQNELTSAALSLTILHSVCTHTVLCTARGIEFGTLTRRFRVGSLVGRGKFSLGVPSKPL